MLRGPWWAPWLRGVSHGWIHARTIPEESLDGTSLSFALRLSWSFWFVLTAHGRVGEWEEVCRNAKRIRQRLFGRVTFCCCATTPSAQGGHRDGGAVGTARTLVLACGPAPRAAVEILKRHRARFHFRQRFVQPFCELLPSPGEGLADVQRRLGHVTAHEENGDVCIHVCKAVQVGVQCPAMYPFTLVRNALDRDLFPRFKRCVYCKGASKHAHAEWKPNGKT